MSTIDRDTVIKTKIDPKDFRANHSRVTVRDNGEFEVTADAEIINEDYDPATGLFTMQVALHYPRRTTRDSVSLAFVASKEGKAIAIQPPSYMLTQADFEAIIRGEVIDVPANY